MKKNGQRQKIGIDTLDSILKINQINISQIDLVIVSTCYSEEFALKFKNYGAKNIIYINGLSEVIDKISIFFVKYFYQNLMEGQTIQESYENAIKDLMLKQNDPYNIEYSCCCNHYHKDDNHLKKSM